MKSMFDLETGSVFKTKSLRAYTDDGKGWANYNSFKGEFFVCMLFGVADAERRVDQTTIDATLSNLGYMPIDDAIVAGADITKFKFKLVSTRSGEIIHDPKPADSEADVAPKPKPPARKAPRKRKS